MMKKMFFIILCIPCIYLFAQTHGKEGKADLSDKKLSNQYDDKNKNISLSNRGSKNELQSGKVYFPRSIKNYNPSGSHPFSKIKLSDSSYTLTNINVDRSPQQVVIPPNSHKAFVLCQGTAVIKVINLDSASVENTIELNSFPVDMTMNADGSKIFIANLSGQPPSGYPSDDCGTTGFPNAPSPVIVINTQTQSIDTSFINICLNRMVLLNDDETIMYVIGAQDYITSYDMNTYALINTYNLSALTGNPSQPVSAALADAVHKLFLRSMVFIGSDVHTQVQILDLVANTVRAFSYDSLGYSSSTSFDLNPVILSPNKQDVYVDAGSNPNPPYASATFIYDVSTEVLKKIAINLSTAGLYIPCSDSTAFYDDLWLFGKKTLFNFQDYTILQDMTIGGCSGVVSPDKQTLYLTQIGAHHDEGVTYGSPQKYDITFLDIATGAFNEVFVSQDSFTCSYERMIAMTTDANFLITTNSALNTVSVLKFIYPVNIMEKRLSCEFKIFPNPNSGVFNLIMNSVQNDMVTIRIFNTTGEVVFQKTEKVMKGQHVENISLAHCHGGLYYLVVTGLNFTRTSKIIIY